jgi:hypothetical protein
MKISLQTIVMMVWLVSVISSLGNSWETRMCRHTGWLMYPAWIFLESTCYLISISIFIGFVVFLLVNLVGIPLDNILAYVKI